MRIFITQNVNLFIKGYEKMSNSDEAPKTRLPKKTNQTMFITHEHKSHFILYFDLIMTAYEIKITCINKYTDYGTCKQFEAKLLRACLGVGFWWKMEGRSYFLVFWLSHRFPTHQWWATNPTHGHWSSVVPLKIEHSIL